MDQNALRRRTNKELCTKTDQSISYYKGEVIKNGGVCGSNETIRKSWCPNARWVNQINKDATQMHAKNWTAAVQDKLR